MNKVCMNNQVNWRRWNYLETLSLGLFLKIPNMCLIL